MTHVIPEKRVTSFLNPEIEGWKCLAPPCQTMQRHSPKRSNLHSIFVFHLYYITYIICIMDPSENSDRSGKFSNPVRIIRLKIKSKAQHTWTATLSIIWVLLRKYCHEAWNLILNLHFCAIIFLQGAFIYFETAHVYLFAKNVFYLCPWKLARNFYRRNVTNNLNK